MSEQKQPAEVSPVDMVLGSQPCGDGLGVTVAYLFIDNGEVIAAADIDFLDDRPCEPLISRHAALAAVRRACELAEDSASGSVNPTKLLELLGGKW